MIQPTPTPIVPGQIIDLRPWNLTLPINDAEIISNPELATFDEPPYFYASGTVVGPTVIFNAPCGGATTKDSKYPRSELRQVDPKDWALASWSTGQSTLMRLTGWTVGLPPVKSQVVIAQIHNATGPIMEVIVDGDRFRSDHKTVITVRWNGIELEDHWLDQDYLLGTGYALSVSTHYGNIVVGYRGNSKVTSLERAIDSTECYYKAGCYTQSNPEHGDASTSFGMTAISSLLVNVAAG